MGIHEDISRKGKKSSVNSAEIASFSNQEKCCASKWIKFKNGLRTNIDRNNKPRKVENDTGGKP
jgi:hypothetical protein